MKLDRVDLKESVIVYDEERTFFTTQSQVTDSIEKQEDGSVEVYREDTLFQIPESNITCTRKHEVKEE